MGRSPVTLLCILLLPTVVSADCKFSDCLQACRSCVAPKQNVAAHCPAIGFDCEDVHQSPDAHAFTIDYGRGGKDCVSLTCPDNLSLIVGGKPYSHLACFQGGWRLEGMFGDYETVAESAICLGKCDRNACSWTIPPNAANAGFKQAIVIPPNQSKPCAYAGCSNLSLYGGFANESAPVNIPSGVLTCTGNGQWKDKGGKLYAFPTCYDKKCTALSSAFSTRCLDNEVCQDAVDHGLKQYSCAAPYLLWYGNSSSWLWETATDSLVCDQGTWYDDKATIDTTFNIACKADKCATCNKTPPPSKCVEECAKETPTISSENNSPYSCRTLKCTSGVFAINDGVEYAGVIKCDMYKKWKTSSGRTVTAASCLAKTSFSCTPLNATSPEACMKGNLQCAQADIFNSNYRCNYPFLPFLEDPTATDPSKRFKLVGPVQCIKNKWYDTYSSPTIIADGTNIICGLKGDMSCKLPTSAATGFSSPIAVGDGRSGLQLQCAPPLEQVFFVNGDGEAHRYEGIIKCQEGKWVTATGGRDVVAASCITKSDMCKDLLTYKNGNEYCNSGYCYPVWPKNGRYSCDGVDNILDGEAIIARGTSNDKNSWKSSGPYLTCGKDGKWYYYEYNMWRNLTTSENAVQCQLEAKNGCQNPPPYVSTENSWCGGTTCNVSPNLDSIFDGSESKHFLSCKMPDEQPDVFWVLKENNPTPEKIKNGKITCNVADGKYYHGTDVVEHVSCALSS